MNTPFATLQSCSLIFPPEECQDLSARLPIFAKEILTRCSFIVYERIYSRRHFFGRKVGCEVKDHRWLHAKLYKAHMGCRRSHVHAIYHVNSKVFYRPEASRLHASWAVKDHYHILWRHAWAWNETYMRSSRWRNIPWVSSLKGMFWRKRRKIDSRHSEKITLMVFFKLYFYYIFRHWLHSNRRLTLLQEYYFLLQRFSGCFVCFLYFFFGWNVSNFAAWYWWTR